MKKSIIAIAKLRKGIIILTIMMISLVSLSGCSVKDFNIGYDKGKVSGDRIGVDFDIKDYKVAGTDGLYDVMSLIPEVSGMSLINYGFRNDMEIILIYKTDMGEESIDNETLGIQERDVQGYDEYSIKIFNVDTGTVHDTAWNFRVPYGEYGYSNWLSVISLDPVIMCDMYDYILYMPETLSVADSGEPDYGVEDISVRIDDEDITEITYINGNIYIVKYAGIIERLNDDGTLDIVYTVPDTVGHVYVEKSERSDVIKLNSTTYDRNNVMIDVDTNTWEDNIYTQDYDMYYIAGVCDHTMYGLMTYNDDWTDYDDVNATEDSSADEEPEFENIHEETPGNESVQLDEAEDIGGTKGENESNDNGAGDSYEGTDEYVEDPGAGAQKVVAIDTENDIMQTIELPESLMGNNYADIYPCAMAGDNMVFGIYSVGGEIENMLVWDTAFSDKTPADLNEKKPYEIKELNYELLSDSADEIGRKYGVAIKFGDNIKTEISDYTFEVYDNKGYIENALNILDETLANYPDGFFDELERGYMRDTVIYLTGRQTPKDASISISDSSGLASDEDGLFMLFLNIRDGMLTVDTIVHEITHIIDHRLWYDGVLDDDEWCKLNPEGFEYYYEYVNSEGEDYSTVDDSEYTSYYDNAWDEDYKDTYFIDSYAKTWPTEDRARLMEYLMGDVYYYNDAFHSEHLKDKLDYYFELIRSDLGKDDWPAETVWEKKLAEYK